MNSLRLSKNIYEIHNIKRAIKDFEGITKILLEENDNQYILTFSNTKYDAEKTKKEFENYLIDLSNRYGTKKHDY